MVETSRFGVLPAHLSTVKNAPILTKYQNPPSYTYLVSAFVS